MRRKRRRIRKRRDKRREKEKEKQTETGGEKEEKMQPKYLDFDDVLPHAGEFGTYQWLLFLGLAPFCLNLVLIYVVHIFVSLPPEHHCVFPQALLDADVSNELK